jgi:hypothetical protein
LSPFFPSLFLTIQIEFIGRDLSQNALLQA